MEWYTTILAAAVILWGIYATLQWKDAREDAMIWEDIADELSEGVAHLNFRLERAKDIFETMQYQGSDKDEQLELPF